MRAPRNGRSGRGSVGPVAAGVVALIVALSVVASPAVWARPSGGGTTSAGAALSIGDATVPEGDSGATAMRFWVTLSEPWETPVTARYRTSSGTATASTDFRAAEGTVVIPAGGTSATIEVRVGGDILKEAPEWFTVVLSAPESAAIADGSGLGTIVDDADRCTAVGTVVGDRLVGTDGRDVLCGLGGPDTLNGGDGDDILVGGPGADLITGGAGADRLYGETGADTLDGMDGVSGNDRLRGGQGFNSCPADPGDHTLHCP